MLVQGRQKSGGQANVSHVCAEAGSLPFAAGCFDAILCFNALPHLESMAGALERMLECLQPNGVLSVGHLMGSENLNTFHSSVNGPLNHDRLPGAKDLAELLTNLSADVTCEEEAPDWYFVQARKRS
jgi:SAM-dependent methyltransferase